MGLIRLKRPQENFNQSFEYKILIDDVEITRLKNGEAKLIELDHKDKFMDAKMKSGSSEKLPINKLKSDQTIEVLGNEFRNKYFKYSGALLPIIGLPFILNHDYEMIKIITGVIFLLYLALILYIGFFQKRKWLKLRLVN